MIRTGYSCLVYFVIIAILSSCSRRTSNEQVVTIIDKAGNSIEKGLLVNGKKEGYWVRYDTNYMIQYDIQYKNGKPNGKVTHFWDGKISIEAEEKNGIRDGRYTSYHNYPIIEAHGYVKEGKRVGEWRTYTKKGELNRVIQFEKDTFIIILDKNLE